MEGHPLLNMLQQQKEIAKANTLLEKSKLLPDLMIGVSNMSMKGMGPDNVLYGASSRFTSASIGVGIPVFAGSQKARVNAAKASERIMENHYQQQLQLLESQYQSAWVQYRSNLQAVDYYEKTAVPNAAVIINTANKQFSGGEINYLDWVMLTNQATSIQNNYLDAVKMLNESIFSINYLLSKEQTK